MPDMTRNLKGMASNSWCADSADKNDTNPVGQDARPIIVVFVSNVSRVENSQLPIGPPAKRLDGLRMLYMHGV